MIEHECIKLLQYRGMFSKEQTFKLLTPSINLLLYCSEFLQAEIDYELSSIGKYVREHYNTTTLPQVHTHIMQKQLINNDTAMRLHDKLTPSWKMRKEFIFEFCYKEKV